MRLRPNSQNRKTKKTKCDMSSNRTFKSITKWSQKTVCPTKRASNISARIVQVMSMLPQRPNKNPCWQKLRRFPTKFSRWWVPRHRLNVVSPWFSKPKKWLAMLTEWQFSLLICICSITLPQRPNRKPTRETYPVKASRMARLWAYSIKKMNFVRLTSLKSM